MLETRPSKVDQVKQLKEDYERLIQEVRDDLLSQIQRALSQLEEIGYKYRLQELSERSPGPPLGRNPRQPYQPTPAENFDAAKTCIICDAIGHDGRAHRRQVRGRRPFTSNELARLGLCPPDDQLPVDGAA
jgi:hypothetical protein